MMRNLKLLLLLIFILIISCEQVKKEKQTKDLPIVTNTKKTGNFDWLLGKWKRVNEEGKKETFENWKKVKNTEYAGIGLIW